jgi:DNA-binding MarR family transcriptional regulator
MNMAFDPEVQVDSTESKIIAALEKISEAFRVLLWKQGQEIGLSPIQLQILVFLLYHEKRYATVSYLAREFNLTKPTISDAVKVLVMKKLIIKNSDQMDHRSQHLILTRQGKRIAGNSAGFAEALSRPISKMGITQKRKLLSCLLDLVVKLDHAGVISSQRMCFSCEFYSENGRGHYCNYLQSRLRNDQLRLDCLEHQPVAKA